MSRIQGLESERRKTQNLHQTAQDFMKRYELEKDNMKRTQERLRDDVGRLAYLESENTRLERHCASLKRMLSSGDGAKDDIEAGYRVCVVSQWTRSHRFL